MVLLSCCAEVCSGCRKGEEVKVLILVLVFFLQGCVSFTFVHNELGQGAKCGNIEIEMDAETKQKDNQAQIIPGF